MLPTPVSQVNIEPLSPRTHQFYLKEPRIFALNRPSHVVHKQAVPITVGPVPAWGALFPGTVVGIPIVGGEKERRGRFEAIVTQTVPPRPVASRCNRKGEIFKVS